jgi:hypothetical protein
MTAVRRRSTASRQYRRYRSYHVSHVVTFGPALALPLWGWHDLHEPFRWAGLGAMAAAGLFVIPALLLAGLYFLPALLRAGCVPRDWRKRYRKRRPREEQRSARISAGLRRVVLAADRNRCVSCRARLMVHADHLEVDHTMPWSLGGLTTLFNCRALCKPCNLTKSNYWRYRRSGRAVYVPWDGWANEKQAEVILAAERRSQWNPLRLLRAAWALGA